MQFVTKGNSFQMIVSEFVFRDRISFRIRRLDAAQKERFTYPNKKKQKTKKPDAAKLDELTAPRTSVCCDKVRVLR